MFLAKTLNEIYAKFWATFDHTDNFISDVRNQEIPQKQKTVTPEKNSFSSDECDTQIYDAQRNGAQLYNAQPYHTQPYHTQPYGAQLYHTQLYDAQQNDAQPYNTQRNDALSFDRRSYDTLSYEKELAAASFNELAKFLAKKKRLHSPQRTSLKSKRSHPVLSGENIIPDKREITERTQKPLITDKQLRALDRKHLLMMIRDLEKELAQEKKEKENLLMVYQMITMQRQ